MMRKGMRGWRSTLCATAVLAAASTAVPGPLDAQQGDLNLGARDVDPILAALDPYVGHWRSDLKTGRDGRTFHFEYDLWWLDPDRTIVRMVIRQVDDEGAVTTVFEGYKGRDPSGDGVYYHGVSPSGRQSRGEVYLEQGNLITAYDGWSADGGPAVRIRDVFEPVEDGRFVSRTFLRPAPEAEWRQIGEDVWTREGPARR